MTLCNKEEVEKRISWLILNNKFTKFEVFMARLEFERGTRYIFEVLSKNRKHTQHLFEAADPFNYGIDMTIIERRGGLIIDFVSKHFIQNLKDSERLRDSLVARHCEINHGFWRALEATYSDEEYRV